MRRRIDLDEPNGEPLALAGILARVHGELLDLGRCADDLQAVIGAIVADQPGRLEIDAQVRLQAADALSQRIERLAELAAALGAQAPAAWTIDPEADGHLVRALSRLGAGRGSAEYAAREEGECELF